MNRTVKRVKGHGRTGHRVNMDMTTIGYIVVIVAYFITLFLMRGNMMSNSDVTFFVNRANQMLNCIKDGQVPFFYYNDFGGVGYGSSFFYGQLTLYPFLPLLLISKLTFIYGYITVMTVLVIAGVRQVCKRFTDKYDFITLMFMACPLTFEIIVIIRMYPNNMGMAFTLCFIAYVIDFFRDNKKNSFIKASLLFYLIINTHLLSAAIAFIITVVLMVYYFDKHRIKDYFKFAVFTALICSYWIINFLYHSSSINDVQDINKFVLSHLSIYDFSFPYSGPLEQLVITGKFSGLTIIDWLVAIVLLVLLFKGTLHTKIKLNILKIILIVLLISGLNPIWKILNLNVYITPFQFSFRYLVYIMLTMYILAFSKIKTHEFRLFISSYAIIYMVTFILAFGLGETEKMDEYTQLDAYIGNGEYVSKDFTCTEKEFSVLSSQVSDNNGNKYDYHIDKNKVIVNKLQTDKNIKLTVPKLYYRGYIAKGGHGEKLNVSSGTSQFISVDIPAGFSGKMEVYYRHPLVLKLLDLICIMLVLIIYIHLVREEKIHGKIKK